ncbi:MAG: type II toxin-antitoxin system antitoxin SocA domain-containing protein [bacterium]
MNKLEKTILYLLTRARDNGKNNLSKFELFKFLYLLEVESYKFTGNSFFDSSVSFARDNNGPISVDVYHALNALNGKHIKLIEVENKKYGHNRCCISLIKNLKKIDLTDSEKLFINSIIKSYINLTIKKLKEIVYDTEPMQEILKEEKKRKIKFLKGEKINFNHISLDEDIVDLIAA